MWKVLMYGAAHGAPVTPAVAELLGAQRSATRAVLLSFHVATRLSEGEGTPKQKAAWASVGRTPIEVIGMILILADLEIAESMRPRPAVLPTNHMS
jgi:hypothetical protein